MGAEEVTPPPKHSYDGNTMMELSRTPRPAPFLNAAVRFASGDDAPRAFLERCLDAVAAWEPAIGAFVHINLDGARAAADRSSVRWRAGKPLSAIDGMPVGIKDIIETADMPTVLSDEAFRVSVEGAIEDVLASGVDCVGLTVMHLIGRHQADAGMMMLLIIPIEEVAAERLGILNAAEALWKLRLVLHRFEVAFRERIVI